MKNKLISLIIAQIFLLGLLSCNNQKSSDSTSGEASKSEVVPVKSEKAAEPVGTAAFKFEETEFDFGKINKGDVVKHAFKFENVGDAPLIISNIQTTCGCTTPQYTKDPIAPGKSGEILVQFNSAGKSGNIVKPVTIHANIEGGQTVIKIKTVINEEIEGPFKEQ
ncbi:DUF1573 domain-containing protein [Flexithrix dorotheae]|uniref:DUF1573 domain-containing protein n=1 Tax=Flexithrix dorotheae TaxID=70993 RepID=UPI00037D87B2|nr:DUF1573 domain-containing protein [Flexithrix dorotheae]